MSDLISRQAMIRMLKCNGLCGNTPEECVAEAIEFVKMVPTAYDVDNVVKKIKGMSGIQFDGRNESYELNWCISTDRAIEIVKGGGKDE